MKILNLKKKKLKNDVSWRLLQAMKTTTSPTVHRRPLQTMGPEAGVLSSLDHEYVQLRPNRQGRPDNRISVKSLIETIENSSKPTNGQGGGDGSNGSSGEPALFLEYFTKFGGTGGFSKIPQEGLIIII